MRERVHCDNADSQDITHARAASRSSNDAYEIVLYIRRCGLPDALMRRPGEVYSALTLTAKKGPTRVQRGGRAILPTKSYRERTCFFMISLSSSISFLCCSSRQTHHHECFVHLWPRVCPAHRRALGSTHTSVLLTVEWGPSRCLKAVFKRAPCVFRR